MPVLDTSLFTIKLCLSNKLVLPVQQVELQFKRHYFQHLHQDVNSYVLINWFNSTFGTVVVVVMMSLDMPVNIGWSLSLPMFLQRQIWWIEFWPIISNVFSIESCIRVVVFMECGLRRTWQLNWKWARIARPTSPIQKAPCYACSSFRLKITKVSCSRRILSISNFQSEYRLDLMSYNSLCFLFQFQAFVK